MVRRAPFPRRSLPANIELFNEAIVCGWVCIYAVGIQPQVCFLHFPGRFVAATRLI